MKNKILLIMVILLALFLRLYKLDVYPAINADEASNAYDAYSLIKTGMDQHGHAWPVSFQSFNDFKPGLYVYLSIPLIKIFGLNPWAVRIPGALAGVLSVYLVYLLVNLLFKKDKLAVISALFLAISPWHIQFSRGGWEVNLATFFILLGLFLFFNGLHSDRSGRIKYLLFSVAALTLSLYAYHAGRVIVPLLGLSILFIYRKEIIADIKPFLIFVTAAFILLIPLAIDLGSPGALSRAAGVGLFADKGPVARINEQRGEHASLNNTASKLIHNKFVNYGLVFLGNWTSHFNGEFLFMSGDSIERNKVPETGQMYLFDIILLGIGFAALATSKNRNWKFIICWLFIAPVASALTFQSPNALRSQNMVIPAVIISALGLSTLTDWINLNKKSVLINGSVFLFILFMFWNFARYYEMYYLYMSKIYPFSSQYGLPELVNYISENQSKYENIFVTTRYDQPYILFLYYSKTDPRDFQFHHTLTSRDEFGFSTVAAYGKYTFGPIDFLSLQENYPNSLIIGTPKEIPQTANIIKRIYGSNNYEYFDVVSN